jgi:hypothetical protein
MRIHMGLPNDVSPKELQTGSATKTYVLSVFHSEKTWAG